MRHALDTALIQQLTQGEEERFVFRDGAEALIQRALDADLDGPDPLASVRMALTYCVALEGKLASPTAAAQLRSLLSREPRAVRLLKERVLDVQPIDRARSFARSEGRSVVVQAPMFGQARTRR